MTLAKFAKFAKFAKAAAAALLAAAFPFAAFAQHHGGGSTRHLDQHDAHLQQRIEQGSRDGSLTRHEAAELQRHQTRIDRMQARALADGYLSRAERARIIEAQRHLNAAIEHQRHNSQRAHPKYHKVHHGHHTSALRQSRHH